MTLDPTPRRQSDTFADLWQWMANQRWRIRTTLKDFVPHWEHEHNAPQYRHDQLDVEVRK